MNLLHINTWAHGGAAKACIRLHNGLRAQGVSSRLLLLGSGEGVEGSDTYLEFVRKHKVLRLKTIISRKKLDFLRSRALEGLPCGFESFEFPQTPYDVTKHPLYEWADIINLHWVDGFLDWRTFFVKNRKPVVWTLHDMSPFTGGYHYEVGFPMNYYKRLIEKNVNLKKRMLKDHDLVIVTPSRWLGERSRENDLFSQFEHRLIPYGLDTRVFRYRDRMVCREALSLPLHKKIVLFVAQSLDNRRKGYNYLHNCISKLDGDICFVSVGSTKEMSSGSSRVIQLGTIVDELLLSLVYSAADLFVMPSIEDNLPNTVIESLCCGTPVIGFGIGGLIDQVKVGFNGYLTDEIHTNSLENLIRKAVDITFDNEKISQQACEIYGESIQASKYRELYTLFT